MKSRYLKVFLLYTLSTALPACLFKSSRVTSRPLKWMLRNALGYAMFAYGLRVLARRKHDA